MARRRRLSPPLVASKRSPRRRHHAHAVRQARHRRRTTNVAVEEAVATAAKPTMDGPPSLPSEPFITKKATSSFQICRGRKPTLITEATRAETSSPPQQPISGHLVFSVHANEPPSASRTQQAIQQHAHERHLHAGQQQCPFCTISSSPPSSRSNGKHLAPAEPISRRPIRPCTIAHESTATAARSCPFSIKFPAVRSVLITKQPWPDLDGHDRSNRRLAAPHDVSS
ncbi:hypothetical protein ACLOJK_037652 [Asimina triloba]